MNLCLWSFQYILYVVIIVRIFSNKLIERHTERIQRLLARKREKLTAKYLGELIERVEIAQKEADLEKEIATHEDTQTIASEIIAAQRQEIERLTAELEEARRHCAIDNNSNIL